ncbi:MAG: GDP-mannose 4,6-dehydratase [Legionella sp.]|uniref:GDP-mannose 4,6-dehydratase n=1 Tax=Legionella sp. TaxID=459 RepID=UPI0039E2955A
MPTVFLTGAYGFTGKYMSERLRNEGIDVYVLDCSITHREAVQKAVQEAQPDWVVHLAAVSFVGHKSDEAFYQVNVLGTLNLLESLATLSQKPKRILIASSANIYGTPNMELIDEQVTPAPVNHYGCSKLAMEHMVSNWFNRLPIIITRPFNYTGAGQSERFLIPKIVSHFAQRKPCIELGNLNISRDFSDVHDVCNDYIALLKSTAQGIKVNICSGKAISLKTIIEYMNEIAGYEIEVRTSQALVRTNEIPILKGSNALLQELIKQMPSIPIEKTLMEIYQYYLQNIT